MVVAGKTHAAHQWVVVEEAGTMRRDACPIALGTPNPVPILHPPLLFADEGAFYSNGKPQHLYRYPSTFVSLNPKLFNHPFQCSIASSFVLAEPVLPLYP